MMTLKYLYRKKYILLLFLLVVINFIDFSSSFTKDSFYRLKYDMSDLILVKNLGEVSVDKIEYNSITLTSVKNLDLIPKKHYRIKFLEDGEEYIFTFDSKKSRDGKIDLIYVVWFFSEPIQNSGKAQINEVKLKREDKGTIKIAMLTEEMGCCLMNGRSFRLKWNQLNDDLKFIGDKKDVYGYNYYGGKNFDDGQLLKMSSNLDNADYYIIWVGRKTAINAINGNNQTVSNIKGAVNAIYEMHPEAEVVLLYPTPSPVKSIDKNISKTVQLLRKENFNRNVKVIDLNKKIRNNKGWESKFFKYDYALSDKAYEFIINEINETLF